MDILFINIYFYKLNYYYKNLSFFFYYIKLSTFLNYFNFYLFRIYILFILNIYDKMYDNSLLFKIL